MTLARKVSSTSLLLSFAVLCGTALGCQCDDYLKTPYQAFDDASVVFKGRVVRYRDNVIDKPNDVIERTFVFKVEEGFKKVDAKEIDINAGYLNNMCYEGFRIGACILSMLIENTTVS